MWNSAKSVLASTLIFATTPSCAWNIDGLAVDTDIRPLIEEGLVRCEASAELQRARLCAMYGDRFRRSHYAEVGGVPVAYVLLHTLDHRVARMFIAIDDSPPFTARNIDRFKAALERAYGNARELPRRNHTARWWKVHPSPHGSFFWSDNDEDAMVLGALEPSRPKKPRAPDVLERFSFLPTSGPGWTGEATDGIAYGLLIMSTDFARALGVYLSEEERRVEQRREAWVRERATDL